MNFTDQSTGNPVSWSWDLGNGNISTLQNPSATYFTPGTYTVRLTATNANGSNTLTRSQLITVYALPSVNFSSDVQTGCFPLHAQFNDLSTPSPGNPITSWQWDFGDGTTSTEQNPNVVYTTAGDFAITLKVTDDKGCSKILGQSSYITVTPGVRASFTNTPAVACTAPATIQFNNTSSGPGIISYQWNFGDGNAASTTSPANAFTSAGIYNVQLVAISNSGCQDTIIRNVSVGGFSSSFQFAGTACPGSGIAFTNTSMPQPDSVRWSFGDGFSSTDSMPVHAFMSAGAYTVWLYNYLGNCIDSISQQVNIISPPVADFTAANTGTCQSSLTVNFQDISTGAVAWSWDFGDNTFSSDQNPAHTYTSYGTYTVTLIATNSTGCSDTLSMPAFVNLQQPQVTIQRLPARGCVPFTLTPIPVITAADAIISYLWDFGDGSTSNAARPTHVYATQGTYPVKLYYSTSTGCTDSVIFNAGVTVGTKPVADFSATPLQTCASQVIQFTNLSSPFDELLWDLGDGAISTAINPSHFYADTGYFDIQLIATNSGCPDTVIRSDLIQILPPISRFRSVPDCNDRLTFSFTDESILPQTWLWDFGDGTTSTTPNPSHAYSSFGTYLVRLTVTNGACSHSSERTITLSDQHVDFVADQTTICKGLPVSFRPTNFNPAVSRALIWNFGDGTFVTNAGAVTHTYANAGNYNVTLIALDVNSCRDTIRKPAYIRVNGPEADFAVLPPGGCVGSSIVFTDRSVTDGINPIVEWNWNFGDGSIQSFTAPPFTHAYATQDTFSIGLALTDAAGCKDSILRSDYLITSSPTIAFRTNTQTSCPGATVTFTNATSPAPAASFWDFGDGTTSALLSPMHSYTDTGLYTIKLISTDSTGCVDSLIRTGYVHIVLPKAGFTVNDSFSACIPLEVQFTNTSENSISSRWDFGPGEGNSSLANPVHYYSTPGVYRVRLIARSAGGCLDSTFITITVLDTAGLRFNYSPLAGCNPFSANFSVIAPSSTQSYFWDFGDGTLIDTLPNVTHVYQSFGNYLPKVVLLDPPGCIIPISGIDSIRIRGANVLFGVSDSVLCDAGLVSFTDSTTSSDPVTSYTWNFGDGSTSSEQQPLHYYDSPGSYDVTLSVITQSGCGNSYTKTTAVKVVARPNIAIGGDSTACTYDSILHTGVFIQPDTSAVSWQWSFPNGNSSALQNPLPQTYSPGTFTVYAFATNSSGCIDTATKAITIYPLPAVDMPGQMTIAVGFSDTIPAFYSSGVNQWTWTPPYALSCLNCATPVVNPKSTTTYQVAFTDVNGCSNTGLIEVIVICKDANFYIPNTFSPNGDGSNDRFYPRGKGLYLIRAFRVFNRWGEVVFENRDFPANDALSGWDGKFKGNRAQPDVYVYQIEILCDNGELIKLSGNIALIL